MSCRGLHYELFRFHLDECIHDRCWNCIQNGHLVVWSALCLCWGDIHDGFIWLSCMPRVHHQISSHVSGWVTLRDLACIMFKRTGFSDLTRLVESDRKSINANWVAGLYKASSSCRTVFFLDCQPSQRLLSYFCNLIGCRSLTFCTRHLCLATYPLTSDAAFKRVASKPWKA